jgi:type 1 glutamine amidotransferase
VGSSEIVATHEVDGVIYPTAWTRVVGRARVAADLLGHDERSYDSEGHRALLSNLARWASGVTSLD